MGWRIPITIGDLQFHSVTAAMLFFRAILHGYDVGEIVTNKEDAAALRDLLMMHPRMDQKLEGQAIVGFKIGWSDHGSRCFYVVRADGSKVHFSYKRCLGLRQVRELP